MAAIRIGEGSKVKIKTDGRVGTVLSVNTLKVPGKRGRPSSVASVVHEDGSENQYGIPELTLA